MISEVVGYISRIACVIIERSVSQPHTRIDIPIPRALSPDNWKLYPAIADLERLKKNQSWRR